MYDSSGSYSTFTLFTLEEFNRFSGQNETLGDNELLLSDPRGTFPADNSITISGREFSIRRTDYNMDDGEGSAMIYDIYYVVVPNMETVEFILEPTGNVLDPLYSYDFDIDGEQEDIAALGSAIRYRFSEAFPREGVEFDSLQAEDSASSYEDFFSLYGGLFFLGLFLGFQYPVEIPGVTMANFMKLAVNEQRKFRGEEPLSAAEFLKLMREKSAVVELSSKLTSRAVNEGFSGGEKKKNEIFQMAMLDPKLAILDETDSGLDIDALRIVATGVTKLHRADNATVVITHYQRLLDYIVPDVVHVLYKGRIIHSGDKSLALKLEKEGYDWLINEYDK